MQCWPEIVGNGSEAIWIFSHQLHNKNLSISTIVIPSILYLLSPWMVLAANVEEASTTTSTMPSNSTLPKETPTNITRPLLVRYRTDLVKRERHESPQSPHQHLHHRHHPLIAVPSSLNPKDVKKPQSWPPIAVGGLWCRLQLWNTLC